MKNYLFKYLVFLAVAGGCTQTAEHDDLKTQATEKYSGPIIDMHIHAFDEGHPMFGMTHPPTLRAKTYEGVNSAIEQKEKTLEKFITHNIVKAVVTNGQLWDEDSSEVILIGGAGREVDALREQHQEGALQAIAEMAPFYAGILANDSSQLPYYELAQDLDIPVGFHIFPGGPNYGFHRMPEMLGGMRAYNASPLQLEDVLVKYPNLRIYIMHAGWPYVDDVKALMYAHPNLYIDIAVLNWILPQAELNAFLKSLINAGFGERIMFGSDQMVWPQVISDGIASINNVEFLTLEQKEDIFYNNAAKFLGLSEEEIAKHKSP
ncbi:amidohydrolase family protein [Catalinimonas alkaloidigena]|uniref:amidohydrolase family protein n=1 Tax=Catalinimonas alkaloidigena TaxID=1075417 RepID=UPI002404CC89|nr:amidohydrolase family protein [Catalinimonas alkaloidigena]